MAKLNFKEFHVPTGISRKARQCVDVREAVADLLYTRVSGIKAHSLAFKIYESDGDAEYSDEEVAVIRAAVERYCLPNVIDGLLAMLADEITDKSE